MKTLKDGLKKLRVLGAFKRAIAYRGKQDTNRFLNEKHNDLMGAFTWSETVEGYGYWSDIYFKLNKYFEA